MGFDGGQILLDSDNGTYYAGQTVFGRVIFDQTKPKTIHGIYVSFKGFCKVHWTTEETHKEDDRDVTETINHDSYEEYFNRKTYVIGGASGEHHLNQGHYEFNFDFPLPVNLPSSFEGSEGHIRYRVKVVMVTSGMFSSNKEKMAAFRVIKPIDLNQIPNCKEPLEFEMVNSYCCWCVSAGSSEIRVKMPVGGYCPGQTIPLEVNISNLSRVEMDEIKFVIRREIRFEATSQPGVRTDTYIVASTEKGPVGAGTVPSWQLELIVPDMEVYNFDACRFISVTYTLKVTVAVSGCHEDDEETQRLVFGSIPIIGYQDQIQNPHIDQLPKYIPGQIVPNANYYPAPAIVLQPRPNTVSPNESYPQNNPYPGNQPYPNQGIQPYPNQGIQPYPNQGIQPYPNQGIQPYPNQGIQPYPNQGIQPYPNQGIQPYPNQGNQPFPSPGNQPYPNAGNVPYPNAGNQPYPNAGNQPFPNVSPYPNTNQGSPYPTGNVPQPGTVPGFTVPSYPGAATGATGNNPNVTNSGSLKTGNFGFVASGDVGPTEPLLPPSPNVLEKSSPSAPPP